MTNSKIYKTPINLGLSPIESALLFEKIAPNLSIIPNEKDAIRNFSIELSNKVPGEQPKYALVELYLPNRVEISARENILAKSKIEEIKSNYNNNPIINRAAYFLEHSNSMLDKMFIQTAKHLAIKQQEFFKTSNLDNLEPITCEETAKELGMARSTLYKLIKPLYISVVGIGLIDPIELMPSQEYLQKETFKFLDELNEKGNLQNEKGKFLKSAQELSDMLSPNTKKPIARRTMHKYKMEWLIWKQISGDKKASDFRFPSRDLFNRIISKESYDKLPKETQSCYEQFTINGDFSAGFVFKGFDYPGKAEKTN